MWDEREMIQLSIPDYSKSVSFDRRGHNICSHDTAPAAFLSAVQVEHCSVVVLSVTSCLSADHHLNRLLQNSGQAMPDITASVGSDIRDRVVFDPDKVRPASRHPLLAVSSDRCLSARAWLFHTLCAIR